jgi:hypothetical protein
VLMHWQRVFGEGAELLRIWMLSGLEESVHLELAGWLLAGVAICLTSDPLSENG